MKYILGIVLALMVWGAIAGLQMGPPPIIYSATSSSLGGSLLSLGGCSTTTVSIPGAQVGMSANASPNTFPGSGFLDFAYVSGSGVVTIGICALILGTPAASTYSVRVIN